MDELLPPGNAGRGHCRTRLTEDLKFPYLTAEAFNLHSCQKCMTYFRILKPNETVQLDPFDKKQLSSFCKTKGVTEADCEKVDQCCSNAITCCQNQLSSWAAESADDGKIFCPATWDGASCVSPTLGGTMATVKCPDFLFNANLGLNTYKICLQNGQWDINSKGREYTDHAICQTEEIQWKYQLSLVKVLCDSVSIVMLCASIFLFLYCRKLYRTTRLAATYRIHTYTFVAMFLYSACCFLSETLFGLIPNILFDRNHDQYLNTLLNGCATVSMLTRFTMNFSYSAMSADAFFLHWNVAFALGERGTIRPVHLMLVAFVVPALVNASYIVVRLSFDGIRFNNDKCWIVPIADYEWIIDGFNICCLALNFLLLISLFRIIFKMELQYIHNVHLSRRMSLCRVIKRADFRAMAYFTVIFGVPQFLVIFQPPLQGAMYKTFLCISYAVQMLQGAFASIALCFLSTEVQHTFKSTALGTIIIGLFSARKSARKDKSKRHNKAPELLHRVPTDEIETEKM